MGNPLFVYGTLRDPDLLVGVIGRPIAGLGAAAPGFVAVHYPGRIYPALVRRPGGAAAGLVLTDLSAFEVDLLDAFEGTEYRRAIIPVMIDEELHEAFAYLPAIAIPAEAKQIAVATDGTVSADGEIVGTHELVRFAPKQLTREGGSLLAAKGKPQDGVPPLVRAGMLESSNVNVVRGVVDLVKVSRTYESLMRVIQGYHDVESRAARELGGPK